MNYKFSCFTVKTNYPCRTAGILIFQKPCMWCTVWIHKPVYTEIAIMYIFPMVTAIIIYCFAIFCNSLIYCMVTPFPYKPATHNIIVINYLEIIFKVSWPIPHCMTVFHKQIWLIRFTINIFLYIFNRRIHHTIYINIGIVIFSLFACIYCTFIMCKACFVKSFSPCQCFLKSTSIGTFISH